MRRAALLGLFLVGLMAPLATGAPTCSTHEGARTASAGTLVLGSWETTCEENEGRAQWSRRQYGASESATGAAVGVTDDEFAHRTEDFECRWTSHGVVLRTRDARAWAGVEDGGCVVTFGGSESTYRSRGALAYASVPGHAEQVRVPVAQKASDEGPQGRREEAWVLVVHLVREGDSCHAWDAPRHGLPMVACDGMDAVVERAQGVPLVPLHP